VNRFRTVALTTLAGFVLVACGPAASGSAGEPSNEASAAAPSQAQESAGGPEPSFSAGLAADLEALIPDSVGGISITKSSMLGNEFLVAPSSDPATVKFVQDLGVSPNDISIAIGFGISTDTSSSVIIFILRAEGAETDRLTSAFKEAQNASAESPIQWSASTLGGKQVEVGDLGGQSTYLYGHGDVLAWVTASTEAIAEEVISGLP
jgi:hypothetical protein